MRSRRDFLRIGVSGLTAAGLGAGLMGKLGGINALAACSVNNSYRALVCVYLGGGNDGTNMLAPIQTLQQNYATYNTSRQGLALPSGSLLPIHVGNDTYGLHPSMPEMQALFSGGQAAILANVGMLVQPIKDKIAYGALPIGSPQVPVNLFSHSDQSSQWQTAAPNGIASTGWGGRMADLLQGMNAGAVYPSVVNAGGCGPFCTGAQTLPGAVSPAGPLGIAGLNSQARIAGKQQLMTFDNGLQLVTAANSILGRGAAQGATLSGLLNAAPALQTVFPAGSNLAGQLKMVARIIGVHSQVGAARQIFFCNLGGFDTHGAEIGTQGPLLQELSQSLAAFYQATVELGVQQQVTAFTTSEFGRTIQPNSNGGTDHAWGNHHFIIGGDVTGGNIYGQYPSLALGDTLDVTGRGSLIPTTAVDEYASTLAQWFGVPSASLSQILPNIGNFQHPDLGFMGC